MTNLFKQSNFRSLTLDRWDVLFAIFITGYALIFLVSPQLGPHDDFVFLRTLEAGKPLLYYSGSFPYYSSIELGRFTPLVALEYDFVALFSNSPFWYFFYHAVEFIIFTFLFLKLLKKVSSGKLLNYLITALFFLLPAFTISWFRLQFVERNIIFFFVVFLLAMFAYSQKETAVSFIIALLYANFALYSKEVSFMAIGAFAFFHFIFSSLKNRLTKKTKLLDILLFASSILYLILYYFIVYLHSPLGYLPRDHSLFASLKNLLNYGTFSDSFIILFFTPVVLNRLYRIFLKKEMPDPLYDSFALAGLTYVLSYFILNTYSPYYLLPAYAFAIPTVIHFFEKIGLRSIPLTFKILGAATIFFMVFNGIPAGIHYLAFNKYLPVNFNNTIDFLIKDISSRQNPDHRPNIFLDGVDRKTGREAYFILAEFLRFKGIGNKKFDFKYRLDENKYPLSPGAASKIQPDFTVFKPESSPTSVKPGDYLMIVPQTTKNITPTYIESLKKDYDLIWKTESPLDPSGLDLKTLLKRFILQMLSSKQVKEDAVVNENLSSSPDYYVFLKK